MLLFSHALRQGPYRRGSKAHSLSSRLFAVGQTTKIVFADLNDLREVKGVGPKTLALLAQLGIHTLSDLVMHFPRAIIDRSRRIELSDSYLGEVVTIEGKVEKAKEGFNGAPSVVHLSCTSGARFTVTYFLGKTGNYVWKNSLQKTFTIGASVVVSGKLTRNSFSNSFDIVNPDFAVDASNADLVEKSCVIEPRYGLTEGLTSAKLRSLLELVLENLQKEEPYLGYFNNDWLPIEIRKKKGWPSFIEALVLAHSPQSPEFLEKTSPWRQRLAFDELVALQLGQFTAQAEKETRGRLNNPTGSYAVKGTGLLTSILVDKLPFNLTNCQRQAVAEIWEQMGQPERMIRCVQGDVGSGKTLVAVLAMLRAVEDGKQAALLAPTEILAKQHALVIGKYFDAIRAELEKQAPPGNKAPLKAPTVALITGGVQGAKRTALLNSLQKGEIDILVGTHALLSESVASSFRSLGLVCIDEEQRFGVNQRDALGSRSNVIYTTATPIPRSLMMVVQKEYDISTLTEKPPTKRPVQTILVGLSFVHLVIDRIKANIPFGSKIFWVTPCLYPSSKMAGSSAMERFEQLSKIFPGKVALLHGKLSSEDKERVMEQFSRRGGSDDDSNISILVSTTVVEVGVDVPDASICIIERAENFGLSQIHQIRGRVGRGDKPEREVLKECFCVLLYQDTAGAGVGRGGLSEEEEEGEDDEEGGGDVEENQPTIAPEAKLQILCKSNDGFEIAESDLKLRGPGDIFGLRQHGEADYRAVDLNAHAHLLGDAMEVALKIREKALPHSEDLGAIRNLEAILAMFQAPRVGGARAAAAAAATSEAQTTAPPAVSKEQKEKGKGRTAPPQATSISLSASASASASAPSSDPVESTALIVDLERDAGSAIVVLLDLETSGLSPESHRIIQLATKVLGSDDDGAIFNAYIFPSNSPPLDPSVEKLTGITNEFLREQGRAFPEVWVAFRLWMLALSRGGKKVIVAAHNGKRFDFPFLQAEFARAARASGGIAQEDSWQQDVAIDALLDTLLICRELNAAKGAKNGLGYLFKDVAGARGEEDLHNAVNDCLALEEVLDKHPMIKRSWRRVANKQLVATQPAK